MGKIIFLQLPTSIGHFNPTKKLMNDLADKGNSVVCYGSQNQFKMIDNTYDKIATLVKNIDERTQRK